MEVIGVILGMFFLAFGVGNLVLGWSIERARKKYTREGMEEIRREAALDKEARKKMRELGREIALDKEKQRKKLRSQSTSFSD